MKNKNSEHVESANYPGVYEWGDGIDSDWQPGDDGSKAMNQKSADTLEDSADNAELRRRRANALGHIAAVSLAELLSDPTSNPSDIDAASNGESTYKIPESDSTLTSPIDETLS